jgi:hypothetical protein
LGYLEQADRAFRLHVLDPPAPRRHAVWTRLSDRGETRNLLGPIYGWFTEGFDTLDLKQAKALLEALAS